MEEAAIAGGFFNSGRFGRAYEPVSAMLSKPIPKKEKPPQNEEESKG